MEKQGFMAYRKVSHAWRPVVQVTVVAITVAACGAPADEPATGLLMAEPESVGMSSERFEQLDAAMQRYIDADMVAGMVTLVAR